ncbi:hypothetical protein EJ04DRAFT_443732, partial [Polyplosphaeria fusca]
TFKDAILYARRLGLAWIWIDLLCIVQDDPLDWKKEVGQLASICQNAFITLSATEASHGNGGFFSAERPMLCTSVPTDFKLAFDGRETPIFPGRFRNGLLSSRLLHFISEELSWECREMYSCLDITYSKDILPALAGIARRWNRHNNDQYLAGLWRASIMKGLTWKPVSGLEIR